ncbi:MAG: hypothetical protein VKN72_11825 [Nostocales cyanobacterium 94392]|nr:hypothetical protein [Nostocales cyanobacterium 94392]
MNFQEIKESIKIAIGSVSHCSEEKVLEDTGKDKNELLKEYNAVLLELNKDNPSIEKIQNFIKKHQ